MKIKYGLISFLLYSISIECLSQINASGFYYTFDPSISGLRLMSDSTYIRYSNGDAHAFIPSRNVGIYKIVKDTLYLYSDKNIKTYKYLIINDSSRVPRGYWKTGDLVEISEGTSKYFNINNHERLSVDFFIQKQSYYPNGNLIYNVDHIDREKDSYIKTWYYPTKQVERIESYYKNKKSGIWYYYSDTGEIYKMEVYKKDKLKKSMPLDGPLDKKIYFR